MQDALDNLMKGRTSFVIAHRLSTIMHADVIYVLERGKVAEIGTHDDLLLQKGLYYAMWRQQVGERRPEAVETAAPPRLFGNGEGE